MTDMIEQLNRSRRAAVIGAPVALVALIALLAGCIGEVVTEPDRSLEFHEVDFHPDLVALGVSQSQMSESHNGVWRRELEAGTGLTVVEGTEIRLDFHGWLPDGQTFRSSSNEEPTLMTVGSPTSDLYMPIGLHEGLLGMKGGGQRIIVVPPSMGYGRSGWEGIIPGYSWLVFHLHVLQVVSGGEEEEG